PDALPILPRRRAGVLEAMTARADPHAYPPRGLSRDEAARWIGVGPTKFDEMVRDGRMPRPKRIDGRTVWDRYAIDAAFSAIGEGGNAIDDALRRGGKAA